MSETTLFTRSASSYAYMQLRYEVTAQNTSTLKSTVKFYIYCKATDTYPVRVDAKITTGSTTKSYEAATGSNILNIASKASDSYWAKTSWTVTVSHNTSTGKGTCAWSLAKNAYGGYPGALRTVSSSTWYQWSTASDTITLPTIPVSYTVAYKDNAAYAAGGTVSNLPSSQTKSYSSALTLSSNIPTVSGYTFTGWNTKADGTGTSYSPGASYSTNAALTLYAQWEQKKVNGIFHVYTDGEWVAVTPYVYSGAAWQAATGSLYSDGEWKS